MRVLVSGSSGLIGRHLLGAAEGAGHEVVRLVRPTSKAPTTGPSVTWDPSTGQLDGDQLEGIDAVVHLAGAGIGDKRWSASYKAEIRSSRLEGTRLLAETLARLHRPPKVAVLGSAIGYYGSRGDEILAETSSPGKGFLAELCREWEHAGLPLQEVGTRVCWIRTGIVLAPDGGVLAKQLPMFRSGLGGALGSGHQWMSWIDIDDEVRAILHLLTEDDIAGPVNLVAPRPVRNRDFAKTLGAVLGRPSFLQVPAGALEVALGREMAHETALASQRCLPAVLEGAHFSFTSVELRRCLERLLGR
jgi:uncharacterized protein (TIGR01777 family)